MCVWVFAVVFPGMFGILKESVNYRWCPKQGNVECGVEHKWSIWKAPCLLLQARGAMHRRLFAPFLLYQSDCCRTVHFPFLSLHHPPPKPKHLKAQFEQWNVWYILVLSDGTMSMPWGVVEVILYWPLVILGGHCMKFQWTVLCQNHA